METDDISAMVGGEVKAGGSGSSGGNDSQETLLADSGSGSGGVGDRQVTTTVGKTVLSKREVAAVKQSLIDKNTEVKAPETTAKSGQRSGVRSEESVTLVFDQNKSVLFSLYNRARRKNPGLKGKIVLELTIAPTPEWLVLFSVGYLDATFDEFCSDDPFQFFATSEPGCPAPVGGNINAGLGLDGKSNLEGNHLEDSPEWDLTFVTRYEIELSPTSIAFLPGHRIRLDITSSDFPNYDRNHNTAADQNADGTLQEAAQTIHHGREYPTRIVLPWIP